MATIGYGDRVPHTCKLEKKSEIKIFRIWKSIGAGRIVTACLSMIGIAFFSLPAVSE